MAADTPQTPEEIQKLKEAEESFATTLSYVNDLVNKASTNLKNFDDIMKITGLDIKNVSTINIEAANTFNLISTKLLQVSSAFDNLSRTNNDFSNSFAGQFKFMQETASTALSESGIAGLISRLGGTVPKATELAKMGFSGLTDYAMKFFQTMDQRSKLGNFFIESQAAVGGLSTTFAQSANPLDGFNDKLSKINQTLLSTQYGTHLTAEQISGFYSSLAMIPGAMDGFAQHTSKATEQTSILQASIELAKGTGTSYQTVITDISNAYEDLNLKGSHALDMTSRIAEISTKMGLRQADVRNLITTTAESFKYYGNSIDGASQLALNYSQSLSKVGLSSKQVTEIISGFTTSIHNLGAAQKAYISQQTGGPGGLQGAFQIDKMLSEGKISEVFDKMKGTIQKQFGKILTLDDATQSQQAAAQFEKQIQLLTTGPMNQIVKTREQAQKLLQSFKEGQSITPEKLSSLDATQLDQRKRGAALLDLQGSAMSIARADIRAQQVSIEGTNFALGTRALSLGPEIERRKGDLDITHDTYQKELKRKTVEQSIIKPADKSVSEEEQKRKDAARGISGFIDSLKSPISVLKGFGNVVQYGFGTNKAPNIEPTETQMKVNIEAERIKREREMKLKAAEQQPIKRELNAEARFVVEQQRQQRKKEDQTAQEEHRHIKDGKEYVVKVDINALCTICHKKIHTPQTGQPNILPGKNAGK